MANRVTFRDAEVNRDASWALFTKIFGLGGSHSVRKLFKVYIELRFYTTNCEGFKLVVQLQRFKKIFNFEN